VSEFDSPVNTSSRRQKSKKDDLFDAKNIAALSTWGAIFALSLYLMTRLSIEDPIRYIQIVVLFLIYAASFIAVAQENLTWGNFAHWRAVFLAVMLLAAFSIGYILLFDFLSILTIIWAAVVSYYLSLRQSVVVVLTVILLWFAMISFRQNELHWIQAILYGSFHMFALLLATSNKRERTIAEQLQRRNAELQATQKLLTEASKQTERTRIARDLHDLLGHHLTALAIKLQVASRLTEGDAKSQVDECHVIAKLLLNDVREAVSTLRESGAINVVQAIKLLTEQVPKPKVHLSVDDSLSIENITKAETLLRCIQESITNSMKHAGADNLWLSMKYDDKAIITQVIDDGHVDTHWRKGNGIRGMEERLNACGGTLLLSRKDSSLEYIITIPV